MSTAHELKRQLLRLLEEDEEFRYAVAGRLGLLEILKRLDGIEARLEEHARILVQHSEILEKHGERLDALTRRIDELTERIEALTRQVEANTERIDALTRRVDELTERLNALTRRVDELTERVNALTRRVDELTERVDALTERVNELTRTISALGARWGILAEEAFRAGMRGVVEELFGGKVERWEFFDREGRVFGYPSLVEVDLVVKDDKHILIEVKSSVSRGDVIELAKIGELYESSTGVKPELAVVSPFVDDKAREAAKALGIKVYTAVKA